MTKSDSAAALVGVLRLADLRTEYCIDPLGIGVTRPRLSWRIRSERRGTSQAGYRIQVAENEAKLQREIDLVWDSRKVESSESTQVTYNGPSLISRQRYYWRVCIWDERGLCSPWSAPSWWEMGLLTTKEWAARWIEPRPPSTKVPLLRRAFTLQGDILKARVYVTSHGLYQLFLNGSRVGDAELTPGFTSYHKRLQYQTYEVTHLVRKGENAVGAMLGEGWYRNFVLPPQSDYGDSLSLLLQLEVTYCDSTTDRIMTDAPWASSTGPILTSNMYAGEVCDARLEQVGWNRPGFDATLWAPVKVTNAAKHMLVAQSGPPVRRVEQLVPKHIHRTSTDEIVVDMGQNMVGWMRLSVEGPAGTTVTLRHAEVLDATGALYTANLGRAQQTVRYTLKGDGIEVFEPHFTFHGFRYVAVEGYPGELLADKITGIVVHSDLTIAGDFECSDARLNQLHRNIVWSLKGNFVDIPTDCPQRAERLGWTGDAQLFAATAAFNAEVAGFLAKWLKDLVADQLPNGNVRWVAPEVVHEIDFEWMVGAPEAVRKKKQDAGGVAGWGDAATIVPWILYQAYGDRRVLEDHYNSMARWVAYERERAGPDLIWEGDFHFGDHADMTFENFGVAGEDSWSRRGATNRDLIATAYFAHSADLLSRAAQVLGKPDEAARAQELFEGIRVAFQRRFVSPDSTIGEGTQAAYVLALQFGLLPQAQRAVAAEHLVKEVRRQGHLTTGILGSRWLLFALSEYGYLEDAYRLLLREDYPSWLYSIRRGATTIWERWDAIKPDGSFPHPIMDSFNHYALGSVGEWMYRLIGGIGIDPNAPGYKHILIEPRPGGGLTWAKASHLTPYGRVSSSWSFTADTLHLHVEVPPNTSATVRLPFARQRDVLEGGEAVAASCGVTFLQQVGADLVLQCDSGQYEFSYPVRP